MCVRCRLLCVAFSLRLRCEHRKKRPLKKHYWEIMAVPLSVFYESNNVVFVCANLLRSWKCPDPSRLWLHSGSPGMWPAPSPAPLLCWQTTSLEGEMEEGDMEKDREINVLVQLTVIKAWRMAASITDLRQTTGITRHCGSSLGEPAFALYPIQPVYGC